MKTGRPFTLLGSVLLAVSSALHASGYSRLLQLMQKEAIAGPVSSVLKALWLIFSILLFTMAVIVILARNMERGGALVLISAAGYAACAVVMWHFVGFFFGVYLMAGVSVLLAIGGFLQLRLAMETKA